MLTIGVGGCGFGFHALIHCSFHDNVHPDKPLNELEKELLIKFQQSLNIELFINTNILMFFERIKINMGDHFEFTCF